MPLSYRNQSIDLPRKSMDRFLYDNGLRHERVKNTASAFSAPTQAKVNVAGDLKHLITSQGL